MIPSWHPSLLAYNALSVLLSTAPSLTLNHLQEPAQLLLESSSNRPPMPKPRPRPKLKLLPVPPLDLSQVQLLLQALLELPPEVRVLLLLRLRAVLLLMPLHQDKPLLVVQVRLQEALICALLPHIIRDCSGFTIVVVDLLLWHLTDLVQTWS